MYPNIIKMYLCFDSTLLVLNSSIQAKQKDYEIYGTRNQYNISNEIYYK